MVPPIIVFSSINQDETFQVSNLPLMIGETIISKSQSYSLGGKGANIAVAAAAAIADENKSNVHMFASVGKDQGGESCVKKLSNRGVNTSNILIDEDNSTGRAIILLDEGTGDNSIIVTSGCNSNIHWNSFSTIASELFQIPGCILAVNLEISAQQVELAIRQAKQSSGTRVVLNASPARQLFFAGWIVDDADQYHDIWNCVDYIVVNQIEARQIAQRKCNIDIDNVNDKDCWNEVVDGMRESLKLNDNVCIVMTLGENGTVFSRNRNSYVHIPVMKAKEIVDTTGAGDTLLGYFCAHIAIGKDEVDGLKVAASAATICCEKKGASEAIPLLEDVIEREISL